MHEDGECGWGHPWLSADFKCCRQYCQCSCCGRSIAGPEHVGADPWLDLRTQGRTLRQCCYCFQKMKKSITISLHCTFLQRAALTRTHWSFIDHSLILAEISFKNQYFFLNVSGFYPVSNFPFRMVLLKIPPVFLTRITQSSWKEDPLPHREHFSV